MSLVKAKLISTDGGGTIEFMFNPNELSFTRRNSLTESEGTQTEEGLPKVNFSKREPCHLTIGGIIIDTYEQGGGKSVMPYIKQFEKTVTFLDQSGKKKRPPTYVLTWGKYEYLRCFVTDLTYKLIMFLPDGTPVRAKVDLTLKEVDKSTAKPDMNTPNSIDRENGGRENMKK